jgi:hypothetical protein
MGIRDMGDELYLLKNFRNQTGFIIMTGCESAQKGSQATAEGANIVLDKPQRFENLLKTVNHYALKNLICPGNCLDHVPGDAMRRVIDTLFKHSPKDISTWLDTALVSDIYMRKLWKNHRGVQVRQVLFLYHLYQQAFSYFGQIIERPNERIKLDAEFLKQNRQYFLTHRQPLARFFSKAGMQFSN